MLNQTSVVHFPLREPQLVTKAVMKSMKSRQNPIQSASSVGKTNYHSSRTQSKKNKKTTLSAVHQNQRDTAQVSHISENPDHHLAATDGQPIYAESWPSTDSGSSPTPASPSFSMEEPKQSAKAEQSTVSCELGAQQDSVLAKYMERFRHGQPQSREERQQKASSIGEELSFWWMSSSSLPPSSTPTKTTGKDNHGTDIFSPAGQHQRGRTPSPCRGPHSMLSDTSLGEFDDTDILHLQERASRLLQRGDCTISDGSIPVSSEGLACSDLSSPVSVDEPVQRPLVLSLKKRTPVKVRLDSVEAMSIQKSPSFPFLVPPAHPQEDILFQWRLRRKMEQAREWSQSQQHSGSMFSWQGPSLRYPSANEQTCKQQQSVQPPEPSQRASHSYITAPQPETKEAHRPCPLASDPPSLPASAAFASSASQPHSIGHVPAHMHLLCDVLPCPIRSSPHASEQQSISQRPDALPTKGVPEKTQKLEKSEDMSADESIRTHIPAPPPASSGAIRGEWPNHHKKTARSKKEKGQTKDLEKNEKKTAVAIRKQKKFSRDTVDGEQTDGPSSTNRSSAHQRVSKKVTSWTEQPQQDFSSESCAVTPPPSPIHSALGQVVSEVLFPTADSTPAKRTPVSPVSPAFAPPQSSFPPCSPHNSLEVISQLLQEAEDSDEREFEDDPLLQILRKQRKWVKEQISEVDSMLDKFLDEQRVT